MSKFSIIPNGGGTARYSGCPTFTGTYMKPGMLEFREIASPTPIDWHVGDYVEYTRTGITYRLYSVPQVKKQARSTEYGGAFVYQGVQFFDDSKQLEICPFRDLVPDDNRIHFSTQPAISVFDNVAGIAERLQACLDDMYPNSWTVRLATTQMGASSDLVALMAEDREFSVSGVSILGALDKIYEVWPEVGWTFSVDSVTGKNVLTIGGAGLTTTASYEYGKGNGLKSITRVVANADEMATRIFAYGSSRNMLPRWYNNQTIKDAESVDIQNLMIPVSEWGKTNVSGTDLPDPAKAYIDADGTTMARLGLRPKTYYFDGTGDLPEIYPSIREMTIGDVRTALGSSSAKYYPSTSVYTNASARVDTVLSVGTSFDDGLAGEDGKSSSLSSSETLATSSGTGSVSAASTERIALLVEKSFTITKTRHTDMTVSVYGSGSVSTTGGAGRANLLVSIQKGDGTDFTEIKRKSVEMPADANGDFKIQSFAVKVSDVDVTLGDIIRVYVSIYLQNPGSSSLAYSYSITPTYSFVASWNRAKTFNISLRQIGFDINEQADLGSGKTIAMRSGKCAGRSFVIQNCSYVQSTDSWSLEVIRSQDDSLSQWFPNTDYPIVAGDEFVLLDIAMPDMYVSVAEQRLLAAAGELLADVSVERWQYNPEIDAKFMVENSRVILPAQNMTLADDDIVDDSPVAILIDSVTISEGEAPIPTYKVTLRDRKKKTFTEAKGADSISSNPVTNATQESIQQMSNMTGETFFELDDAGNVTLKPQYQNFWVPGFSAAGGIGNGGGGGGGRVSYLNDLLDVTAPNPSNGDLLVYSSGAWVNVPQSTIVPSIGFSDLTSHPTTLSGYGITDAYTKSQVDSMFANIDLSDYVTQTALATTLASYATLSAMNTAIGNVNVLVSVTTTGDGTVDFTWHNGDVVKVDLNHEHSNYVPITRTINGVDLSDNRSFYILRNPLSTTAATGVLYGVSGISYNTSSTSASNDNSRISWSSNTWTVKKNLSVGGTLSVTGAAQMSSTLSVANAITLSGNTDAKRRIYFGDSSHYIELDSNGFHFSHGIYSEVWVAAGGVGSGNGSGSVTYLTDLDDVNASSPSTNDILYWSGTAWVNTAVKTVGGTSLFGTGNIAVGGGTTYTAGAGIDITGSTLSVKVAGDINTTGSTIGGIKVGSVLSTTPSINAVSATAGKYYYVECDANGVAFVNVPWVAGSSSGGTLSEVGLTMPTGFEVVNSPLTSNGALQVTFATGYSLPTTTKQTQWDSAYSTLTSTVTKNRVLASPASASGTPSFRALVADDIPNLDGTYVTKATTQDITATKTFTVDQSFKGSVLLYSSANLCGQIVAPGYMVFRTGTSMNLSDSSTYKQLSFTTSAFYPESPINLGTSGGRWANFYGANADLTGNLSLASTSHIDLGPVRLEYDSDNSALHVTTNVTSGTIPTIGIYADGFVAAGGVGGDTQYVRYVTCSLADYNALTEKDEGTIYIVGSPVAKVCLGSVQLYSES